MRRLKRRLTPGPPAGALLAAGALAAASACAPARPVAAPPVLTPPPSAVVPATTPAGAAPPPAADTTRAAPATPGGEGDRRFQLVAVDDSTVTLLAPRDRWLRPGTYGIAVDPRRRDALVARLYVQSRSADTAVALVTGQTTRMSADYVAIFRRPETPVLRQGSFWGGLAAGVAVGAGVVAALLRGR